MTPPLAAAAEDSVTHPLRVLAVDDQPLFLDALAALLGIAPDVEIVGRACDGAQGVERAAALRPDVVLMDVDMPRLGGIEATRLIVAALPGTAVVMVTGSALEADVERAKEAGASGYVMKDRLASDLLPAIRTARRPRGRLRRFSPRR